jgi:hypothetical protein
MVCTYCGTNLTIPQHLRTQAAVPKTEKIPSKAKPASSLEIDGPDLIRKVQPAAISAWNLYALWTRLRWILPACLVMLVLGFILCVILGVLPFVFRLFK